MYSLFDFHVYFALKRQYLCTGFQKSALKSKKKEEGYRTQDKRQNTIVSEVISL